MEPLKNFNLSVENTSSSGTNTDTICYNMNAHYFATEDFLGWYIANCVVNILLATAASLENLLILIAIWRTSTLHTPSYVLLFCLVLSDLGVGLVAQPLVVIYTIAKIQRLVSMACVTGVAVALLGTYLCSISLFSITAVSIDRYLALYLHLRYKQLITNKRVIALLVCTWLSAALVLVIWLWHPPLTYVIGVALGLGCIIITSFCFSRVYLILRHHLHQIRSQPQPNSLNEPTNETPLTGSKHYRRSVVGMFIIYVLLLLCYIPYLCISCVVVVQGTTIKNRLIFELMRTVLYANSAMNPLIYCWRLRDIRTAVLQHLPACVW